jgi:hypothetical protein
MEYLIGSLVALVAVTIVAVLLRRIPRPELSKITYSQSHIHNLVAPYLFSNKEIKDTVPTQATNHLKKTYVRVLILNKLAYWIRDNVCYVASVENGEVLRDTARQVDTMTMTKIELEQMQVIVEKLTEG